jgi:hypothetical protein
VLDRELRRVGAERPRDAEVDDLDVAVGRQQDVLRLHVAMDDPLAVRVIERRSDAARDMTCGVDVQPPEPIEERAERGAVQMLHDDEEVALALAVVVDGADVRVGQPRGVLRFGPEPLDEGGV